MAEPPLLVGISGPSSSGKTTLSRLLRDIFPPQKITILHLDDFYLTDAEIPLKNGVQDWDCLESLNLPLLRSTLQYIRTHSTLPPDFISKEDQNSVGPHGCPPTTLSDLSSRISTLLSTHPFPRPIIIVDGFLLFSESMAEIRELFDVRLFLRTSYVTAKKRREARKGYVTLEGFWEDPPGYVDQIVWPNYVAEHAFLFEGGDVEGRLSEEVCGMRGIRGMPEEGEGDMGKCLEWAVGVLEQVIRGEGSGSENKRGEKEG